MSYLANLDAMTPRRSPGAKGGFTCGGVSRSSRQLLPALIGQPVDAVADRRAGGDDHGVERFVVLAIVFGPAIHGEAVALDRRAPFRRELLEIFIVETGRKRDDSRAPPDRPSADRGTATFSAPMRRD